MLKYTFLIYVNQNFTKYIVGFMVGYFNLIESKKYSIDLRYTEVQNQNSLNNLYQSS